MGGHNLCIPRCKNNQNETKLLISSVRYSVERGKLAGKSVGRNELEQQPSSV